MNHEQFFECVRGKISELMGDKCTVSLNRVIKNNGLELTGVFILEKGQVMSPTIYLDDFFKEYEEGRDVNDIVGQVAQIYEKNSKNLEFDLSFFSDYDRIRPKIMYKLLNYESNKKLLKDVPHKRYMDLAIVFYIMIDHDSIGNGSILIHNTHADIWKVTSDELYGEALKNTPKLLQYRFSSMENVVGEIFGTSKAVDYLEGDNVSDNDMYVLTNNRKLFGASCLLYDGLLKRIANKLKGNLFIIPSSIHELIIIPQKAFPYSKNELMEMVRDINANEVDLVDILSDNVYEYKLSEERIYY